MARTSLSKGKAENCIGLHGVLKTNLRLGSAKYKIKERCILEGDILVWDDSNKRVESFYKIRKARPAEWPFSRYDSEFADRS
jgi:hypothetical protein